MLRAVYDESDGYDGYVSLRGRPGPRVRHATRTMEQAREYWGRVDRPNLMIKIPGTDEGLPAIEQMIYEGLNINVTLLFKVERTRRSWRLHPRASSAATRRASRSTSTRSRRSSCRASTPRSTSGWRPPAPTRTCSARPGSPTRAPPTRRFKDDVPRRALRSAARRRRAGAAPAVGVDRRQEPAATRTRSTSTG